MPFCGFFISYFFLFFYFFILVFVRERGQMKVIRIEKTGTFTIWEQVTNVFKKFVELAPTCFLPERVREPVASLIRT